MLRIRCHLTRSQLNWHVAPQPTFDIMAVARVAFRFTPWAAIAAAMLTFAAMAAYPGGTWLDPAPRGYSFLQNSLSDLGARVAWNGQPNSTSATLFGIGFCLAAISGAGCLAALIPLYSTWPRARLMSRFAGAFGAVACVGLAAAALVAEDRHGSSHRLFSTVAAIALVGTLGSLAAASALAADIPRVAAVGYLGLDALLLAWLFAIRHQPTTPGGVTLVISLQKALALAIVLTIVVQTRIGQRVATSRAPAA